MTTGVKVLEYELVKGLEYQVRISPHGVIFHTSFKAKRRDDPDAKSEVFFPELFIYKVIHCYNLGCNPAASGAVGPDTCPMCSHAVELYHPKGFKNWFHTYKSGN